MLAVVDVEMQGVRVEGKRGQTAGMQGAALTEGQVYLHARGFPQGAPVLGPLQAERATKHTSFLVRERDSGRAAP